MTRMPLTVAVWKWLIGTLGLAALFLLGCELYHAAGPLWTGQEGRLGAVLEDQMGFGPAGQDTHQLRVVTLVPGSAAERTAMQPGARVSFEHPTDRWRRFAPGETLGLLGRDGTAMRHVVTHADRFDLGFAEYFDYLSRCALSLLALLFCLLIGFKQPGERAYRGLSLCFLALSLTLFYSFNYSPSGPLTTISKLASLGTYPLVWYLTLAFAMAYQPYPCTRVRALLQRAVPAYRLLAFCTCVYALWFGLGHEAPGLWLLKVVGIVGGVTMTVASLVDGLRQSRAQVRQRHLWLLLSFAFAEVPSVLIWIPAFDGAYKGVPWTIMASIGGVLLMYIGLGYAVLRHRVFNFSFAVSRALVYSVLSAIVLVVFRLVELAVGPLLHERAPGADRHGAAEAVAALLVYLVFHRVHHRVERWVERLLFRNWYDSERRLREFVRRAAHFTTAHAMLAALVEALDRFSQQAGAAVYLEQGDDNFKLVAHSLAQAPPALAMTPALAKALRQGPAPCAQLTGMTFGEVAVPISHRDALSGVVVLGSKASGDSYRPDECRILAFAMQQIGLDLDALRADALECQIQKLTNDAQRLDAELRILAGRRGAVRPATAADAAPVAR